MFIVILCTLIYLGVFAIIENVSFQSVLRNFADCFYSPRQSLMFVNEMGCINANISILYLIIFSSIILMLFRKARNKSDSIQASFLASIIVLIFIAGMQTFNFSRYVHAQSRVMRNKTVEEKKSLLFGDLYAFSEFCKHALPGRHKGRLITDINLDSTSGANNHLALAYNLFPITIQYNPRQRRIMPYYVVDPLVPEPIDALIVYKKKNPELSVPQNFRIINYFDQNSLLAVRKE